MSLFIFAGEASGDLHGGNLLKALKKTLPEHHLIGVGGPCMREAGLNCILQMEDFALMGFSDVFRSLPKLLKHFFYIRDEILKQNPEAVIFIDYPGFNLRMAKALRKKGYRGKLIHYICPTVWAWGKKRIKQMNETLDLLLTIYPFEASYFSHTTLKVIYVGNPVKENILKYDYKNDWTKKVGIQSTEHLVALFPGSRKSEIEHNFPKILQMAHLYKQAHPSATFAVSCANNESKKSIVNMLDKDFVIVPSEFRYELMRDCHVAVAKSGTVTLELALHKRPTIVVYEVSNLNRFIAQHLLRLKIRYFCIVNVLSAKEVFPEFIRIKYTPETLSKRLQTISSAGALREQCIRECANVYSQLEESHASIKASETISDLLR